MIRLLPRPLALPAFALAASTLLLPAPAAAEGDPAPPASAAGDPTADSPDPGVRFAPVTHHIFGGEQVDGRTLRPDGDWVSSRLGGANRSLVRIRTTFRAELLQSAEDL